MLFEPTILAAMASALVEAVKPYGCDPEALFRRAGLDINAMMRPGARYPFSATLRLWREARKETVTLAWGSLLGRSCARPLCMPWVFHGCRAPRCWRAYIAWTVTPTWLTRV